MPANHRRQKRKRYPAHCWHCGNPTTVPFFPRPGRLIHCLPCWRKTHPREHPEPPKVTTRKATEEELASLKGLKSSWPRVR